jgi:ABC-type Mn2+/Zn2+ transport system permease subunit
VLLSAFTVVEAETEASNSAVLAIIFALFSHLLGQKINLKTQLPYGPFLITISVLIFFLASFIGIGN